jgi:hypothetical protein
VKEERDPPPLVLLRCEDVFGEGTIGFVDDRLQG